MFIGTSHCSGSPQDQNRAAASLQFAPEAAGPPSTRSRTFAGRKLDAKAERRQTPRLLTVAMMQAKLKSGFVRRSNLEPYGSLHGAQISTGSARSMVMPGNSELNTVRRKTIFRTLRRAQVCTSPPGIDEHPPSFTRPCHPLSRGPRSKGALAHTSSPESILTCHVHASGPGAAKVGYFDGRHEKLPIVLGSRRHGDRERFGVSDLLLRRELCRRRGVRRATTRIENRNDCLGPCLLKAEQQSIEYQRWRHSVPVVCYFLQRK